MPAGNGVRKLLGTRLGDRSINPILWASPQMQRPRPHPAKPDLIIERKWNVLLPFLLPNPVAAHDKKRDALDGPAEILKENRAVQNLTVVGCGCFGKAAEDFVPRVPRAGLRDRGRAD
jgi:hypothetical protein